MCSQKIELKALTIILSKMPQQVDEYRDRYLSKFYETCSG